MHITMAKNMHTDTAMSAAYPGGGSASLTGALALKNVVVDSLMVLEDGVVVVV